MVIMFDRNAKLVLNAKIYYRVRSKKVTIVNKDHEIVALRYSRCDSFQACRSDTFNVLFLLLVNDNINITIPYLAFSLNSI